MADLVSQSGTRIQAPDHLVKFLNTRGYKVVEAVPTASTAVPVDLPDSTPKRRTRKPRVTTPESD